jgi:hypothetical protein
MVWHQGIIIKLKNMGIKDQIITFIKNFQMHRTIQVRIRNTLCSRYTLQNGISQGSILSLLLFLILINDVPTQTDTKISLFADDSATYKSGTRLKHVNHKLEQHLNKILEWCDIWGFKISTTKPTRTIFTRKRKLQTISNPLRIKNKRIPTTNSVKFLGLIFDK